MKHCREQDGRILFADDSLELSFSRETGRWLGMRELAGGSVILQGGEVQSPVVLTVGGTTTSTLGRGQVPSVVDARAAGMDALCTGYECTESPKGPTLVLHRRDGDWFIDECYHLAAGRARVDRSLAIRYEGAGEVRLRGMEVRIPPATWAP